MRTSPRSTVRFARLAIVIALGAGSVAAGEPIVELIAGDATPGNALGNSTAVSGTIAIAGAHQDDDNGTHSGSAYLFDVTTGQELHKLLPDDGWMFDQFGFSVAIDGNVALAGAYTDDDEGESTGAVYVFDVTTGDQDFKLVPDDGQAGDFFGFASAVSGNIAVIGAPGDDDLGSGAGSAYLFDVTTGLELFKLNANDGTAGDVFGNSVAIDGNLVIVGAPGKSSSQGAAYLFDATTGLQADKLTASSPQPNAFFGRAVGVSGNRAVVGAPFATFIISSRGLAYIFDTNTGNQLFQLMASDASSFDRFGGSAAISGGKAIVGASDSEPFGFLSGSAYVYDVATGQQESKLTSTDATAGELFGHSLALSGERAVIGSVAGFGGVINSGTAHAFELSDAIWDNLGNGSIGVDGIPSLLGIGDLSPRSDLCLALGRAEPVSPTVLILGLSSLFAPAKGGIVVPNPDVIIGGFATDANGQLVFPATFPSGVPSGIPLYMQFWVEDSFGFFPLAASNGITKTTP